MPKAHTTDIAWVAGVMPMFQVGLIARVVVGQFIGLVQYDDCRMLRRRWLDERTCPERLAGVSGKNESPVGRAFLNGRHQPEFPSVPEEAGQASWATLTLVS